MRQLKWIMPLIIITVMLGGCPYGSGVPISKPIVPIDPALVGKWQSSTSEDIHYAVTRQDDYTYKIVKTAKKSSDVTEYRAFLSTVAGDKFLNVYDEKDSPRAFYLYKVKMETDTSKVTLAGITENIDEKFMSSEDLQAYIAKYKDLSFFYDKTEDVYVKGK